MGDVEETGPLSGDDADQSQEERGESATDTGATRRDALKKAAGAAAIGAAVWSAPKLDGFSIVPDYAAAGTGTTGVITFRMNGVGPSLLGGDNSMTAAPSPAYNILSNNTTTGGPVTLVAPLGPIGNAVYNFPSAVSTDGAAFDQNVVFNVDPPFNMCVVIGGTADWEGSTSDRGQTNFGGGANQSPNTTSPRTVNVPAGGGGPSAGNNFWNPVTKLNWVEVRIQCT